MIRVYHAYFRPLTEGNDPVPTVLFFPSPDAAKRIWTHESPTHMFALVAEVPGEDWDEAFRLTNNVDSDWTENPAVTPIIKPCRSTSVGDVMWREKDGAVMMVAGCGFTQLEV